MTPKCECGHEKHDGTCLELIGVVYIGNSKILQKCCCDKYRPKRRKAESRELKRFTADKDRNGHDGLYE